MAKCITFKERVCSIDRVTSNSLRQVCQNKYRFLIGRISHIELFRSTYPDASEDFTTLSDLQECPSAWKEQTNHAFIKYLVEHAMMPGHGEGVYLLLRKPTAEADVKSSLLFSLASDIPDGQDTCMLAVELGQILRSEATDLPLVVYEASDIDGFYLLNLKYSGRMIKGLVNYASVLEDVLMSITQVCLRRTGGVGKKRLLRKRWHNEHKIRVDQGKLIKAIRVKGVMVSSKS